MMQGDGEVTSEVQELDILPQYQMILDQPWHKELMVWKAEEESGSRPAHIRDIPGKIPFSIAALYAEECMKQDLMREFIYRNKVLNEYDFLEPSTGALQMSFDEYFVRKHNLHYARAHELGVVEISIGKAMFNEGRSIDFEAFKADVFEKYDYLITHEE